MKWVVTDNPLEVSPVGDLKPHLSGAGCWCNPFMDDEVIVHNSLDGREKNYELGKVN